MKDDPRLIAEVKEGHIVQLTPDDVHSPGRLLVVEKVESWGVVARVAGADGVYRRAWQFVEPTGGKVVFDKDGNRLTAAPVAKHHA